MPLFLPPAPPVPRTKEQQQTAFSNAAFWTDWYTKLREVINEINTSISGLVTTASGDLPGGYPVLDDVGRINTEKDIVVNDSTQGIILKSDSGNYFRIVVSGSGTLSTIGLGSTLP
jgi:hypothetical protein